MATLTDEPPDTEYYDSNQEARARELSRPLHERHGHPPLEGPDSEYWMKWDEWEEEVLKHYQANQIDQFEILTKQSIEWFYERDAEARGAVELPALSMPEPPPDGASYDEKRVYLRECYTATLNIALPKHLEPALEKRRPKQTSLDKYRVLYQQCILDDPWNTVRLLEILPAELGEPLIETRLFTADLESIKASYEALSYAWGTTTNPREMPNIRVNGLTQRVTSNLYGALLSLRLPDKPRTIWVDSVCINQGDLKERGQQVKLMSKIYAHAERTIVYLGPSSPAIRTLFAFLELPVCGKVMCDACQRNHGVDYWTRSPIAACREAGLDVEQILSGFVEVCSRSWWDRIWILQEYTLSKKDPVFYCGRDTIGNMVLQDNFQKIYSWVMHRKLHPEPLSSCDFYVCQETIRNESNKKNGVEVEGDDEQSALADDLVETEALDREDHISEELVIRGKNEECADGSEVPSACGTDTQPEAWEDTARWKAIHIVHQGQSGREWESWGSRVWKAHNVMKRRATCRPWQDPSYVYRTLQAQCSDPHDIVYGILELMEPVFREMFPPDYTVPIPKLYTRVAAYMIIFHSWTDMFWHYPHRLSRTIKAAEGVPSWTPDLTKPVRLKEAEQTPPPKNDLLRSVFDVPQIMDRILFMTGWLVDEVLHVYPFPEDDPYKVLQQLWYVERVHCRPSYRLFDGTLLNDSIEEEGLVEVTRRNGGISPFPTIAWATKYADKLTSDVSLLHVINQASDFSKIPETVTECLKLIRPCVEAQFDAEGKQRGASAPREVFEEYRARRLAMEDRLFDLLDSLLEDKWIDFVGVCTFDYENLRAQVYYRIVMISEWKPARISKSKYENDENKCNPPLDSAVLQRPIRYSSLLTHIAKDIETEDEVRLREDAVMMLAEVVRDATTKIVGRRNYQPIFINIDEEWKKRGNDVRRNYEEAVMFADETERRPIDEFMVTPLPEDVATGVYKDGQLFGYWGAPDDVKYVDEPSILRYFSKGETKPSDETVGPALHTIVEEEDGDGSSEPLDSDAENGLRDENVSLEEEQEKEELDVVSDAKNHTSTAIGSDEEKQGNDGEGNKATASNKHSAAALSKDENDDDENDDDENDDNENREYTTSTHSTPSSSPSSPDPNEDSQDQTDEPSPSPEPQPQPDTSVKVYPQPFGPSALWWRMGPSPNDPSPPPVHFLLTDLVDFLSGRELFITESGLQGLTGPGTHGVRDGDDLFVLKDMAFPLVGRLEPHPKLGNPKARRRDVSTIRMRREIIGNVIVRDIDTQSGQLDNIVWPGGLEPISTEGQFRFK